MDDSFIQRIFKNHQACGKCPRSEAIADFYEHFLGLLFPNFASKPLENTDEVKSGFAELQKELQMLLVELGDPGEQLVTRFMSAIPELYERIDKDIEATYEGDPAATSKDEVVRSYPGFYAIAAYRVAHSLLQLQVPILPRAITEHAHSKTGIDIHPGATIGEYFCIDHGTGVVIGETTIIGNHVKIYQGVTLGALSVAKEDANIKRHPTIEDHVVIYSGATILGGQTVIGEHSVVGGNVWLTRSVPAHSKIYYKASIHREGEEPDMLIVKH